MTSRTDHRPSPGAAARRHPRPSRKAGFGGTLLGVFVGVALGLALAAGVAYYVMRAGNPYLSASPAREPSREPAKGPAKPGGSEQGATEKPRFDFYKILPGVEEPKVQPKSAERAVAPDKATAERAASPDQAVAKVDGRAAATANDKTSKAAERFWLQAGSFASEADAENLKARLAFAGWQAAIQTATVPDRGLRYRVRLGPYDNTDELTRMKGELAKRGFDVAVIKF
jgi:cell division protein FtsN